MMITSRKTTLAETSEGPRAMKDMTLEKHPIMTDVTIATPAMADMITKKDTMTGTPAVMKDVMANHLAKKDKKNANRLATKDKTITDGMATVCLAKPNGHHATLDTMIKGDRREILMTGARPAMQDTVVRVKAPPT